MTNHIQFVFVEHDFVVNKTYTSRSAEKNWFESLMLEISTIQIENFWYGILKYFIICSCFKHCMTSTCFVKSLRNTHWTHTEYDWSVYWLAFYLICKFHRVWRSIRKMYRNCRVKILASSLKRTVRLFGRKDSNLAEHEENNAFVYTINVGYLVKIAW